jgi:hypothetical protein
MSGTVSSALFWTTATGAAALGVAWTSPAAIRVVVDVLLVAWLVVSNVR